MTTKSQLRKRIKTLETKVKALEVENFNLFCSNYASTVNSALDDLKYIEPPLDPLPTRKWWDRWLP